jgi:hypothetical protein
VPECHYLAIDPGKTTGWASFNEEGKLVDLGQTRDIAEVLKKTIPKIIIVENFKLHPWQASKQSWSDFPASRVIGKIEFYCDMADTELIKQDASCKETGYKWGGIKKAKVHKDSHQLDAVAHGVFYLIKNKIRKVTDYVSLD